MALGQRDDGPLAVPCPFARTAVATAVLGGLELLVLALGQADDDISLAGAQGHDVGARGGAHGADGLGVGGGGFPPSLVLLC